MTVFGLGDLMWIRLIGSLLIAASLAACPAAAEALRFAPGLPGWTAVEYPGIAPAHFAAAADGTLAIATDSSAGMLWRLLPGAAAQSATARWRWRVDEGVAPTDLTSRGADDRAIGIYFVFSERPDLVKNGPMAVLASPAVTALVYVFGGDQPRGTVIASPHMGARGKFIALRRADALKRVWYDESVDLARDYARAFGRPMTRLIGVAISSDSDDTRTHNRAGVQGLMVGE
jgi:hypothetical protein